MYYVVWFWANTIIIIIWLYLIITLCISVNYGIMIYMFISVLFGEIGFTVLYANLYLLKLHITIPFQMYSPFAVIITFTFLARFSTKFWEWWWGFMLIRALLSSGTDIGLGGLECRSCVFHLFYHHALLCSYMTAQTL